MQVRFLPGENNWLTPTQKASLRGTKANRVTVPSPRISVDLGAHKGGTINKALREFPDFDLYCGYEAVKILYDEAVAKFAGNNRVRIYNLKLSFLSRSDPEVVWIGLNTNVSFRRVCLTFFEVKRRGNTGFNSVYSQVVQNLAS